MLKTLCFNKLCWQLFSLGLCVFCFLRAAILILGRTERLRKKPEPSRSGIERSVLCVIWGIDRRIDAEVYTKTVLRDNVLPLLDGLGPSTIFMQDNAPAHRAQITRQFLDTNMINMLDWP